MEEVSLPPSLPPYECTFCGHLPGSFGFLGVFRKALGSGEAGWGQRRVPHGHWQKTLENSLWPETPCPSVHAVPSLQAALYVLGEARAPH